MDGRDRSDKRIDATTIQPPHDRDRFDRPEPVALRPRTAGQDPVDQAETDGENLLNGALAQWEAHDLDAAVETASILDVRTDAETAAGAGALHAPHTQLRERLSEPGETQHREGLTTEELERLALA